MISKQELEKYAKDKYTIAEVINATEYTRSQIVYACKKYNIKLRTIKQRFNADPKKVKALLDNEFSIQHIADILKVNTRCIYNIMHRNGWAKKRQYVSKKGMRKHVSTYGLKIKLNDVIRVFMKDGSNFEMLFSEFVTCQEEFFDDVKYIIVKEQL